jgi:hypothetical protein
VLALDDDVVDVAARLREQQPPDGLAVEGAVDLVFRRVGEHLARGTQLGGEQSLGVAVLAPPLPLGARLPLRFLGQNDLHDSASS